MDKKCESIILNDKGDNTNNAIICWMLILLAEHSKNKNMLPCVNEYCQWPQEMLQISKLLVNYKTSVYSVEEQNEMNIIF